MGREDGCDGNLEVIMRKICQFIWSGKACTFERVSEFQKLIWLLLMHFEN